MIDARTLAGILRGHAAGKKDFAVLGQDALGYAQLWREMRQCAGLFDAGGLAADDRILVVSRDDSQCILLFLAALLDGKCPVLLPPDTPGPRIEAIAAKLRPACVFVDADIALLAPGLSAWPTTKIERPRPAGSGMLGRLMGARKEAGDAFPALLSRVQARDPSPPTDDGKLAFISFTSGTTAFPKGVMTTHRNLSAHLATLVQRFDYGTDSRILNNMVLSHNDGLVQGPLLALACGGTLLRPRPLDVRTMGPLLEDVYVHKATHFITVPTILAIAAERAEHDDYFKGPEFRHLISVAAKLDALAWQRAEQRFGVRVNNIYGLTETVAGGVFCGPDDRSHAIGSVGQPVDMQMRIVDPDGGDVVPGDPGELWLRGDNACAGYWEDPDATAALHAGDWLRTGDLARIRPDGNVEICGRIKALVVSGGFSVHPDEVDEVLQAHPDVIEAASIGVPHREWGEVLVSAVVLARPVEDAALFAHCRGLLEPKKLPARIHRVEVLPRGRSGKVDRKALAQLVARVESGAAGGAGEGPVAGRLLELAARVFRLRPESLSLRDTPDSISGWDSLNHLELVIAAEKTFQVQLGMVEVMQVQSLGDLLDVVERERARA